jgi:RNA polymerase sigma-70 factor, ECF subfamily
MTRDETMARDFTQETFVRAFERLREFRGESALSTWLYAIGVSIVLNGLRKVKRHRQHETALDEAQHVAARRTGGDPVLRTRLHAAMDRLSDGYRAVFVMHDMEGYKHDEIATILGIPVGTSKARLARARESLRAELGGLAAEGTA